jgi:hypothetical protein
MDDTIFLFPPTYLHVVGLVIVVQVWAIWRAFKGSGLNFDVFLFYSNA